MYSKYFLGKKILFFQTRLDLKTERLVRCDSLGNPPTPSKKKEKSWNLTLITQTILVIFYVPLDNAECSMPHVNIIFITLQYSGLTRTPQIYLLKGRKKVESICRPQYVPINYVLEDYCKLKLIIKMKTKENQTTRKIYWLLSEWLLIIVVVVLLLLETEYRDCLWTSM